MRHSTNPTPNQQSRTSSQGFIDSLLAHLLPTFDLSIDLTGFSLTDEELAEDLSYGRPSAPDPANPS